MEKRKKEKEEMNENKQEERIKKEKERKKKGRKKKKKEREEKYKNPTYLRLLCRSKASTHLLLLSSGYLPNVPPVIARTWL
jgi:hypothetical protein